MEKTVLVTRQDGQATLIINRPKVLNAIDWETFFALQKEFDALSADPEVKVIIITGSGSKAFISGGDIKTEKAMDGLESYHWSLYGHKICSSFENSPKPVIAAVNGYALGGGLELMLSCDFCLCSDNAFFGAPEVKLGVICGFGGNLRLARKIGKLKAKELLMTGQMIDAQEALRLNLVNKVVAQADLAAEVDAFCANLLDKNSITLELIKKVINYGTEMDLNTASQFEAGLFGLISGTEDKYEGMNAFLEKRPPIWKNK